MQEKQIEKQIERIQQDLQALGPMRPGTLSRQYAACQKPGCACVDPVNPKKHGPFYQLSYSHQGKSTTRFVRPGYVARIKKELAAYKRFRWRLALLLVFWLAAVIVIVGYWAELPFLLKILAVVVGCVVVPDIGTFVQVFSSYRRYQREGLE